MALTEDIIRDAKPKEKAYKLSDEKALFLLVQPSGAKYWRFKYRIKGKEKQLSLGVYPEVSLIAARSLRDNARTLLTNGVDPSANRKAEKHPEKKMKTRDEFVAAIKEMVDESAKSGFSLVIGFDANGACVLAGAGNTLTTLGLSDELHNRMRERVLNVK